MSTSVNWNHTCQPKKWNYWIWIRINCPANWSLTQPNCHCNENRYRASISTYSHQQAIVMRLQAVWLHRLLPFSPLQPQRSCRKIARDLQEVTFFNRYIIDRFQIQLNTFVLALICRFNSVLLNVLVLGQCTFDDSHFDYRFRLNYFILYILTLDEMWRTNRFI